MDRQGRDWNRDGIVAWLPGDLPDTALTPGGATAYPALVDQGDAVGLRLFDTWDEAALSHQEGVLRLLALALPDKFRWMHRQHGLARDAQLAWSTVGDLESLIDSLAWRALRTCVGERAQAVRAEADWEALLDRTRRRLGPVFTEQAKRLSAVLSAWGAINRELATGRPLPEAITDDLASQLEDMIYPDFLAELEAGRFRHYPRYLQGVSERIERARLDPGKDLRLLAEVEPWWQRYLDWLDAGEEYTEALDTFRWLVAEYRVSLFAQRLGTDGKVSPKRLDAAWRAVKQG
jgi:ATP-dependent helicase HrpA